MDMRTQSTAGDGAARSATVTRLGRVALAAAAAAGLTVAGITVAHAADPGQPGYISINGSMEGNLQIQPGDWVDGGYQFTIPGTHPASTVQFAAATVTLDVSCNSNGTSPSPYVINLGSGPYTVTANSSAEYPFSSGDNNGSMQGDPAKWQGAAQIPALCGAGNTMWVNAQSGAATFAANVQSSDTTDSLNVQFHYADSGTISCNNTTQNPPPNGVNACGRSWSSTQPVTPGSPQTSVPEGTPLLLVGVAGLLGIGGVIVLRRGAFGRADGQGA